MGKGIDAVQVEQYVEKSRSARKKFIERVRKEEALANRDLKGYRRKVFLLVALAYSYIFGILLLALGLFGLCLYITIAAASGGLLKVLFVLGIFVFIVVRSLWVKISPPDGVILSRADAPELYKEVDAIADRLKAPRPDDIRIDYQLNAAASQTPRLGVFGWYRNTLLLGMPLLMSLSKDEMRAVIAHEFGHFSGAHGKFGAWAYRTEATWHQLAERFSGGNVHGEWLFSWFVRWFQPRFAATTFALRRANEYEADRAAAEIAGAKNAASGLVRLTYLDPHFDASLWEKFDHQMRALPNIVDHPFAQMSLVAKELPAEERMRKHVRSALLSRTDYDDTHPSLTDRLRALNQPASEEDAMAIASLPISESAAEALFGHRLPAVLARLEAYFAKNTAELWRQRHEEYIRQTGDLERLRAKAKEGPLSEDEKLDLAYLTYTAEDDAEGAERLFQEMLDGNPRNPFALYWLGQILAEREDPLAEKYLREAMYLHPDLAGPAAQAIAKLLYLNADFERLSELRDEATDLMTTRQIVEADASVLREDDVLERHAVSPQELEPVQKELASVPRLQTAYLVNKVLANGERRLCLIAFHRRKAVESEQEPAKLVQELVKLTSLPGGTMIFSPQPRKKWIKRMETMGAKIYEAPKK